MRHILSAQAIDRLAAPDVTAAVDRQLARYASALQGNPRTLKRFVLDYRMLRAIRTVQGIDVAPTLLASWVVTRLQWPAVAERLSDDPTLISTIVSPETTEPLDPDRQLRNPDLKELYSSERLGFDPTPESIAACVGIQLTRTLP